MPIKSILIWNLFFLIVACGGGGTTDGADEAEEAGTDDSVNTEKLIGTPFEGYETGDEFGWSDFQTGQYLTETVDYVPIPIFLAYFTLSEEETIEEGVAIANEGAGFEAFAVIDEWQDDARVIYQVDYIWDPESGISEDYFILIVGQTPATLSYFESKVIAGAVATDWQIELRYDGVDKWVVAHELGHAFGIQGHYLIDYENDLATDDLEENSLMGDFEGDSPALTDYNYMMSMQGALLLRHLGEAEE